MIFLILVIQVLFAADPPIFHEGRFRLLSATSESFHEKLKTLPSKRDPAIWMETRSLGAAEKNLTAYSDEVFEKMQTAYKSWDNEALQQLLSDNYRQLAGKPYLPGLHFPMIWQLKLESYYVNFPWIYLTVLLYCFRRTFSVAFVLHTLLLLARIVILERPPVTDMNETVLYVPWVAVIISWIVNQKRAGSLVAIPLLLLYSATFSNLQPVLNTPFWLVIHVLMIVGSYGAFFCSGVLAHIYLIKKTNPRPIFQSLAIGTALLIPGTILGGVWAAQSWGRFWAWDPKESFAFISAATYLLIIHSYLYGWIGARGLAISACVGLQVIIFTWYGVNYILGTGLHSYGFGNGGVPFYVAFVIADAIFLGTIAKKNK